MFSQSCVKNSVWGAVCLSGCWEIFHGQTPPSGQKTPPSGQTPSVPCCRHYTSYLNAFLLPAATKLGQGNIFTSVCQEFCPQGGYLVWSLGGCTWSGHRGVPGRPPFEQVHPLPESGTVPPPEPGTPPPQTRNPPGPGTPPQTRYTPGIRTMSSQYAS